MNKPEAPPTFRTRVNEVLVPVVVSDRQGHAVGDLYKEDFQVFDRRKPQVITSFAVEKSSGEAPGQPVTAAGAAPAETAPAGNAAPAVPDHFTAYLFDDVHVSSEDLVQARDAALRHLDKSLGPADRAAIFTTSGLTTMDFTGDRAKLREVLLRLRPQSIARGGTHDCPDVNYYQADSLLNRNDSQALQMAVEDAVACSGVTPQQALGMARGAAQRALAAGDHQTRLALDSLWNVVRRVSSMPGQRSIILISPGFLLLVDHRVYETEILEEALHAGIIFSTLNARGLSTISSGGATLKADFDTAGAQAEEDILVDMADGTGGVYFHNKSDLAAGFERLAARPEYVYVLGFSPQNLKPDGGFHPLKVTLKTRPDLTLRTRHGYYVPKHLAHAEGSAKRQIAAGIPIRRDSLMPLQRAPIVIGAF